MLLDDFMRCLFKDNIPLAEFVLRIITGKKDIVITGCETQKDMKRLAGARSICLDAYGTDSKGKKYDLEIQRQDMNYELMAERTRYLKENPKGVEYMCKIMEDMRNESLKEGIKEGIKEGAFNTARRMIAAGKYALEEIVSISGLSREEVEKLQMNVNV